MSTDFRALCAELVEQVQRAISDHGLCLDASDALMHRARAALAAEPEGRLSDEEILACRSFSSRSHVFESDLVDFGRVLLARYGTPAPAPALVAASMAEVSDALIKMEAALADIAEGEETNAAPNTFEWAEKRCAETLAIVRPVMKQHGIRTSEWPPAAPPKVKP